MSDLAIHSTAEMIGEADPLLSMTARQAAAAGGRKAIIDNSGPLATLAAKRRMACGDFRGQCQYPDFKM